jgi:hypothetical protein
LQRDGHLGGRLRIKSVEPAGEHADPFGIQIFDDVPGYIVSYVLPIRA